MGTGSEKHHISVIVMASPGSQESEEGNPVEQQPASESSRETHEADLEPWKQHRMRSLIQDLVPSPKACRSKQRAGQRATGLLGRKRFSVIACI